MALPGENIQNWSTTAATNANSDDLINWAEGQSRASVNDSARSMMAAHAKDRNLKNGSITTGGTANAQTFTSGVGYIVPIPTGLWVRLKVGVTNTGATTLSMDGLAAVAIKDQSGGDLSAGSLIIGRYVDLIYNGTNWILLQSAGATTVPQCGRLQYLSGTALSFKPYNGDLIKINGVIYQIPASGIAGLGNTNVFVSGVAGQNLAATPYMVFVFNNAGVLTADFIAIATAAHATSTTAGNIGTEIKTGDDTRTLIGLIRTNGSNQFQNDGAWRGVISWFNRRNIALAGLSTGGSGTTSGAAVEIAAASRVYFLSWAEEAVSVSLGGTHSNNVAGLYNSVSIGLDGAAPVTAQASIAQAYEANAWLVGSGAAALTVSENGHYFSPLGAVAGVSSGAFHIYVTGTIRG